MHRYGLIKLFQTLEIEIDTSGGSQRVQLSRVAAQQLADALLDYTGGAAKGLTRASRESKVYIAARSVNPMPNAVPGVPVRIGVGKQGVVRIK